MLELLWKDGVEAICPTIVTCSVATLRKSLLVLREARKRHTSSSCRLLGAHLEGPFLSREFLGAHDEEHLASPNLENLKQRISEFELEISLVTLAPELSGAMKLITHLKELGIVISLGHSSSDDLISKAAFENGITMLTHTFNAMPSIHHRAPGPVVEAIINGNIALGLIADGVHIHPKVAELLYRLAPSQLLLVSDAITPYGLPDGKYYWDKRVIYAHEGCCRLENGTLVGVTLPLLEGCKRLANWTGDASSAIWSATMSPRHVLAGEKLPIQEHLLGKSLKQLLRWKTNLHEKQLFWHSAV